MIIQLFAFLLCVPVAQTSPEVWSYQQVPDKVTLVSLDHAEQAPLVWPTTSCWWCSEPIHYPRLTPEKGLELVNPPEWLCLEPHTYNLGLTLEFANRTEHWVWTSRNTDSCAEGLNPSKPLPEDSDLVLLFFKVFFPSLWWLITPRLRWLWLPCLCVTWWVWGATDGESSGSQEPLPGLSPEGISRALPVSLERGDHLRQRTPPR